MEANYGPSNVSSIYPQQPATYPKTLKYVENEKDMITCVIPLNFDKNNTIILYL